MKSIVNLNMGDQQSSVNTHVMKTGHVQQRQLSQQSCGLLDVISPHRTLFLWFPLETFQLDHLIKLSTVRLVRIIIDVWLGCLTLFSGLTLQ
jgi:hypothetical protein